MKLGNRRKTGTEQFYTPKDLARSLVAEVRNYLGDFADQSFLEPACGNGSFVTALRDFGASDVTSIDKYPLIADATEVDYLDYLPPGSDYVTVTNPPFGRNNSLSIPFFNHAASHSQLIAFLVPRSWRKWSVQNRLDTNFHLVSDQDVFVSYEDAEGNRLAKRNELRTCFQIWERRVELRALIEVPDNGFLQRTTPQSADIAIRVFGYGCGTVMTDFPRVANTTLMFLKASGAEVVRLLPSLNFQRFSRNTAYTEALSLPEINFLLNEAIYGDGYHREGSR